MCTLPYRNLSSKQLLVTFSAFILVLMSRLGFHRRYRVKHDVIADILSYDLNKNHLYLVPKC